MIITGYRLRSPGGSHKRQEFPQSGFRNQAEMAFQTLVSLPL